MHPPSLTSSLHSILLVQRFRRSASKWFSLHNPALLLTTYIHRQSTSTGQAGLEGQFVLIISAPGMSSNRQRQSSSFVGYNGRATSACTQASLITLQNGQIFVTYANGTVAQYSANSNDPYDYFNPTTTPGNVTTTYVFSDFLLPP